MTEQLSRSLFAVLLLTGPVAGFAQDYTVKLHSKLNDLAIRIEPMSTETMLVVKLTNEDDTKVRCRVAYEANPELPYKQSLTLKPGKSEQSVFRIRRHLFAIEVDVQCAPHEWGSMDPPAPAEPAGSQ
jgi:hypothetical protein